MLSSSCARLQLCSAGPGRKDSFPCKPQLWDLTQSISRGCVPCLTIHFPADYSFRPPEEAFMRTYHPRMQDLSGQPKITVVSLNYYSSPLTPCSLLCDPNPEEPVGARDDMIYKTE
ncbi:Ubiquitin-conjugating enzyme E2 D3 [Galemys pyrenaicus]|uniref:Ubiquitin-conjugating enzyme E2 D3 n=1 Tax=Galemys pyrenaicus TaxID=202257 RepID=A0A8J6A7Z6_GALPY|nr:Ubiquitin-conjugating enzyme E2 D3 [Galemys pyrenaicus]